MYQTNVACDENARCASLKDDPFWEKKDTLEHIFALRIIVVHIAF